VEARITHQVAAVTGHNVTFYTLTYQTTPGAGVFQAMVKYANDDMNSGNNADSWPTVDIHGDILRLNSYSKSSSCVHDVIHKKWCHCVSDERKSTMNE
jgi:hypothetical protein